MEGSINPGSLVPGAVVGRLYQVLGLVGHGAQGDVYEVEHLKLKTKFALKLLHPRSDPAAVARFEREAKAASKLSHPHIARVVNFDQTDEGQSFAIMEFLQGEDLSAALERGPLTVREACRVAGDVGRALSAAHSAGVVHRDLKPANLFLANETAGRPQVKLTDFGISKLLSEPEATRLTATGALVGTPLYMAPEQASAKPVDHRVDIYALGVVLFEMLAGRTPFRAKTSQQLILEKTILEETDPQQILPELPKPMARVIRRAMARNPVDRHPTAEAFVSDLEAAALKMNFEDHRTLQAAPVPPLTDADIAAVTQTGSKGRAAWWFAGAGAVAGLALVVAVTALKSDPTDPGPPVVPEKVLKSLPAPAVTPPAQPVQTARATLTSNPSGAEVRGPDGVARGRTPVQVELQETGKWTLELKGRRTSVELSPDTHNKMTVHLSLPPPPKKNRRRSPKKVIKRKKKDLRPIDVEID